MEHMNGTVSPNKFQICPHQHRSTMNSSTMGNALALWHPGQHLLDVDIGKVLGLAKAELPQREITNIMNCSKKAVQHTIEIYDFETFQGRNLRHEYECKTTKLEDRYIEHALKQNNSLPLRDITNITWLPVPQ